MRRKEGRKKRLDERQSAQKQPKPHGLLVSRNQLQAFCAFIRSASPLRRYPHFHRRAFIPSPFRRRHNIVNPQRHIPLRPAGRYRGPAPGVEDVSEHGCSSVCFCGGSSLGVKSGPETERLAVAPPKPFPLALPCVDTGLSAWLHSSVPYRCVYPISNHERGSRGTHPDFVGAERHLQRELISQRLFSASIMGKSVGRVGGFVRKVYEREETWIGGWNDDRRLPCKRRKTGCEAELSVRIGRLHPMVGQNELEEYINPRWPPVITPSFCRLGRYSMPLLCADDTTVHSTLRKRMGILEEINNGASTPAPGIGT